MITRYRKLFGEFSTEECEDNKIRFYDSDDNYLGYIEVTDETTPLQVNEEVKEIETIEELLDYLGEQAKISKSLNEIHSYMVKHHYGEVEKWNVKSVFNSEFFNRLGDYYLAIIEE